MQVFQSVWSSPGGFTPELPGLEPTLILVFGARALEEDASWFRAIAERFPNAVVAGCSSAGEVLGASLRDDSVVVTCIKLQNTTVRSCMVTASLESYDVGSAIADELLSDDLAHVLVFSDGLSVNGSQLCRGLREHLPRRVAVTGGLAADGERFERTWVCGDDGPVTGQVLGVGLYGRGLRVAYGSVGGWDPFGPERRITRAAGNVLYELDGEPALSLYRRFLGQEQNELPAAALRFPISLRDPVSGARLVRTVLSIDGATQSMTFAGDMPEGSLAQLMKANFDRLIDGAQGAATLCRSDTHSGGLALLISCVGRRLVLQQRVEEELEAVCEVLGKSVAATGFYSYGEISPVSPDANCDLHNQTMTITTLDELSLE